ncbi:hypothetical protein SLE2022_124950 [Rubroshorea leprosula]
MHGQVIKDALEFHHSCALERSMLGSDPMPTKYKENEPETEKRPQPPSLLFGTYPSALHSLVFHGGCQCPLMG